jgi:SAM-dependent methyltransferase
MVEHLPFPLAVGAGANDDRPRCVVCNGLMGDPFIKSHDRLCGLSGEAVSVAACEACGLGITLPLLDAESLGAFYPSSYSAYAELPSRSIYSILSRLAQGFQAWQTLRAAPMSRLSELPRGRVLDVGCGRGDLGSWLIGHGWSVDGIEPSPEACAVARTRGVQAWAGTMDEVEVEPKAYDAVVFRHSLEHVADPLGDLRRAREALRDGGLAIVSLPNFGCWQRRRFGGRWLHLDLPRHRFHFNPNSLQTTLELAGFTQIATGTSTSAVGLPGSIQYTLAGRCLFPSGLALRAALALCAMTTPFTWLLNRLAGEGDVLYGVGQAMHSSEQRSPDGYVAGA